MKRIMTVLVVAGWIGLGAQGARAAGNTHFLGVGGHYWTTVDKVDIRNVDDNGVGWFGMYRWMPGTLLGLEGDVEVLPNNFGGAKKTVLAPQAYVLVGSTIYAGVGIGDYYTDGDFSSDPFYGFKAGLNLPILPSIYLDVSGNYRVTKWDSKMFDNLDTDTVTLAAAILFGF